MVSVLLSKQRRIRTVEFTIKNQTTKEDVKQGDNNKDGFRRQNGD